MADAFTIESRLSDSSRFVVDLFTEYLPEPYWIKPDIREQHLLLHLMEGDHKIGSCTAVYYMDQNTHAFTAKIQTVYSTIGRCTGTLLLAIQLRVAHWMGVSFVTLDNMANDPVRASKGIYSMFEWNTRSMNNKNRRSMRRKTNKMRSNATSGEMILFIGPDFMEQWNKWFRRLEHKSCLWNTTTNNKNQSKRRNSSTKKANRSNASS